MYLYNKNLEVHVHVEIIFKTKIFIWNNVHVNKYVSFKRHNVFLCICSLFCLSSVPTRRIDTFISTIYSTVIDIVWKSSVINVALFLVIGIYLLLCLIYFNLPFTLYSAENSTINTPKKLKILWILISFLLVEY
jgi:hypothetical protein